MCYDKGSIAAEGVRGMQREVYADLFFLVNFSMDFLCAYLTATLLRRRMIPWRMGLAAALGGVYAVLALVLPLSQPWGMLCDVGVCVGMCAVMFFARGVPLRFFGAACAVYAGVSMAMGGIMTALFNLLNRTGLSAQGALAEQDGMGAWLFALLAAVGAAAGLQGGRLLRRSASRRFARLSVTVGTRTVQLQALVDSGNLCRDPISGRPVIFIAPRQAQALIDASAARRFRLIPVGTVDGRRMQIAYLPDCITLEDAGGTRSIDALFAPAAALSDTGVYQAIVASELVT